MTGEKTWVLKPAREECDVADAVAIINRVGRKHSIFFTMKKTPRGVSIEVAKRSKGAATVEMWSDLILALVDDGFEGVRVLLEAHLQAVKQGDLDRRLSVARIAFCGALSTDDLVSRQALFDFVRKVEHAKDPTGGGIEMPSDKFRRFLVAEAVARAFLAVDAQGVVTCTAEGRRFGKMNW